MAYLKVREGGTLFPKDRCVVSFDGTHIAYTFMGQGEHVIALCAGYCCPDNFWRYLAPALAKKYRVLIWNYRGCGVSGMPREPGYRSRNYTVDDFMLERYAQDLQVILDHEGIDEVALVGHSMGTQVALESYRLMPKRITAIASITGPYTSAIHTIYNTTFAPKVFPAASFFLSKIPTLAMPVWRGVFRSPIPHPIAVRLGILGPETKDEDMAPYYEHMAEMDPQVMLKMAQAMHMHSAEDLLKRVKVPTLVIVGERDNFVPPWLGHVMASRIPNASLVTIAEGTHGTIVEFPRRVNKAVTEFFAAELLGASGTVSLAKERSARRGKGKRTRSDSASTDA